MKRKSQILSIQVSYEEFHALSVGRQRYVILSGRSAPLFQMEPGDFIELIEKPDEDMKGREAEKYVVQITHTGGHTPGLDPEYQICSVARVTDVSLRLREAIPA